MPNTNKDITPTITDASNNDDDIDISNDTASHSGNIKIFISAASDRDVIIFSWRIMKSHEMFTTAFLALFQKMWMSRKAWAPAL